MSKNRFMESLQTFLPLNLKKFDNFTFIYNITNMSIEETSSNALTPAQDLCGSIMGAVMTGNNDDPSLSLELLDPGSLSAYSIRLGSVDIMQRVRVEIMNAISDRNLRRVTVELPEDPILGTFESSNEDAILLCISKGQTELELNISVV